MEIIDFHTHIYPLKIAEKATQSTCDFYGISTDLTGTAESLLDEGKKAGISRFVLLPVAVKPEQLRHINEFVISQTEQHSEFYGFGALHAAADNILEEVDFIENSGLKGIKLHPDIQQFNIDDPRLFDVYDFLGDRLPILIHCGDPRHDYSHPRRLRHILDEFPRLRVIAAHLGGWSLFDTAKEYLKDTQCLFDISSCLPFLSSRQIVGYIRAYGAERILFGTDFPLWHPEDVVNGFMKLDLTDGEREKIAFKNALGILT